MHHPFNAAFAHQGGQIGIADVPLQAGERQALGHLNIQAQNVVVHGQTLTQLAADVTGGAGDQNAAHGAGLPPPRDQISARVRPEIKCHTPQRAAIRIIPEACGKKVNRIDSPRPEF